MIIYGVWRQHHQARWAVALGKKKEFLESNVRLPFVLHLLMGTISLILIVLLAMLPYETLEAGALAIFSVSFVFCLLFLVAVVLDDPYCEAWNLKAPKGWIDQAKEEARERRERLNGKRTRSSPRKKAASKKRNGKRAKKKTKKKS